MARSFNGTSDLIRADAAQLFSASAAFSIAAWAKGLAFNAAIYAEATTASINNVFLLATDNSGTGSHARVFIKSSTGATLLDVVGTKTAFDSSWHHLCYTQDGARNYALYVDGALDRSGSYSAGTVTPNDVAFGALVRSSIANYYSGTIAEVATWARQLSAQDAASLAAGLPASHLGPAHYWPLWGADSPEPDIGTATHISGTLTGTAFASGGRVSPNLLRLSA